MLSSKYISESIPRDLWERYSGIELDFILAFADRARNLDFTALWYADKLKAMGILREGLEVIIAKNWKGTQKELADTLEQAGFKALTEDEKIFRQGVAAGLLHAVPPIAESVVMRRTLEAGYRRAIDVLNLTNTTAVNTTIEALDEAYILAATGAKPLQAVVFEAVTALSEQGITGALYPSGRRMELAPYVRMVVQTSVMQTTTDMSAERMKEYGSDLVEISSHAGCRPSHFDYQGRIYSWSGKHPKYPSIKTTGYGTPGGLFGINCAHFAFPWIEGLDRVPTREERDPAKYELGKSNTAVYDESQEQRYYERGIREWKHRAAAMSETGLDDTKARAKVKEWQARQRAFIEESGRTRRYDRERVA